ncbi:MAG TPA: HAD-IIA family hydrolase [Candidatus Polarisedimenticolia bacterium]|jgi:HAD superfamily hydrolase (TIGR01458 family)|nr:HAD-IIA family hydrolase [Candidatus Polarisedimenticolia bacterium]
MSRSPDYRGVLFDVDGTLLSNDEPVPGAAQAIERLRARGVPFRIGTNTTRRPRSAVAGVLGRGGIRVTIDEVLNPAVLARRRILESGRTRAALLVPPGAREDFAGVTDDETRPDWIVLGDLGRGFTFEVLNRAYHGLRGGARLIALHKNRVWNNGVDGVVLDAGPYVAALEYASGVEAELVGKPSRRFFELAVAEIGLPPAEVLVVGDDLEADCRGGAAAGCRTALVLTGGTTRAALETSGFTPDRVCLSVAEIA